MSLLELIKCKDDRQNFELTAICATMIHVARFTSMSVLCYDVPCICKSPAKAREISLKTQLIYAIIYFLEMIDCLVGKIITPIHFLTVIMSFMYLLMIFIISYGICIVKTTDDLSEDSSDNSSNSSEDSPRDFSWYFLTPLIGGSFVLAFSSIRNEREFIQIFTSCLNVFALIPQFFILRKVKIARNSARFFILGMVIQTVLMLPGTIDMIYTFGLKEEYYQLIFIGVTLIINFVCFLTLYPWKVVTSTDNDNQQNRENQNIKESRELADLPPNVIVHQEQRRAIIEAGNDNNPDGINEEKQDVKKTKKKVNFQPDIVSQQSQSEVTNPAGAADENEQTGRNEDNQDTQETRI